MCVCVVCMYACVCLCVCTCVCACMYVCVFVYPCRYDNRSGSLPGPITSTSGGPIGPGALLKARKGKKQVREFDTDKV